MEDFVRVPEQDWQDICDAVRSKTGAGEKLLSGAVALGITGIKSDPTLQEITVTENGEYTPDEGVDGFGKVTVNVEGAGGVGNILDYSQSLNMAFYKTSFKTGTELDISFGTKAQMIDTQATYGTFRDATGLKSIKLSCGFATHTNVNMQNFVRSAKQNDELEILDLSGLLNVLKPTSVSRAFEYHISLREILGEFDMTNCTIAGDAWAKCSALETVGFKAGTIKKSIGFKDSPNLTNETIQSILDGLADLTGDTAQTLTFHADVGAKLTDEQKASASAKNWTINY